jgi:hypothetical protein
VMHLREVARASIHCCRTLFNPGIPHRHKKSPRSR